MGVLRHISTFLDDTDGAITVDWVALTAGVLLVGIMVVYAIANNGVSDLVSGVNSTLDGQNFAADIGTAEQINQ
ncbi:MAG: hypothetical protein OEN23_08465 [Paracoccaceae bacterium]|nr:hypothetical protein [Paracoccaceae bacterium]